MLLPRLAELFYNGKERKNFHSAGLITRKGHTILLNPVQINEQGPGVGRVDPDGAPADRGTQGGTCGEIRNPG